MVQASKVEALLATDLYNASATSRSLEAFVVHMHLAWLYLLHAEFLQATVDYRYWDDRRPNRLKRIDGEPKTWDLQKCVETRWQGESEPVRLNLEFFIGLRNKIEHRYERGISAAVAGHAQSLILNYENELVGIFGADEGLADRLRFPLFLSSLTDEGIAALKRIRSHIPARTTRYIQDFHAKLTGDTASDPRFEFKVYLVPQVGPKTDADLAIRFVNLDRLTPDERAVVEKLGRTGLVATRLRRELVQNLGKYRPRKVVELVKREVPDFTMGDFIWYWKHYKVRPDAGAPDPAATDPKYCVYDEPVETHLYTDAWVRKLIRESSLQALEVE